MFTSDVLQDYLNILKKVVQKIGELEQRINKLEEHGKKNNKKGTLIQRGKK